MKTVKVLLIAGAVLGIGAAALWQFYFREQAASANIASANIASAYAAKQVCSCRFIGEREMQSCLGDFTNDISALSISQSQNTITAKAPYGLALAQARYSPSLGCALIKKSDSP